MRAVWLLLFCAHVASAFVFQVPAFFEVGRAGEQKGLAAFPSDKPLPAIESAFAGADDLERKMIAALMRKFAYDDIDRVIESWKRVKMKDFVKDWPGLGRQSASSYVEGLTATPWHDTSKYKWVKGLEENWQVIADEVNEVMQQEDIETKGVNIWTAACRDDALAYGPDWRTLVLQDRKWEETNSKIFHKTTGLLQDLKVPTCEAFFARQAPRTGIKPHTDFTNFILTAHLPLDVPEGDCTITVGVEKRKWENGKVLIFDTSFIHETDNNTDGTRTVLLMRFWHPELTMVERKALQFVFDCLEDHSLMELAPVALEAMPEPDEKLKRFLNEIDEDQSIPYSTKAPGAPANRAERRKAEREAKKKGKSSYSGGGGGFGR